MHLNVSNNLLTNTGCWACQDWNKIKVKLYSARENNSRKSNVSSQMHSLTVSLVQSYIITFLLCVHLHVHIFCNNKWRHEECHAPGGHRHANP